MNRKKHEKYEKAILGSSYRSVVDLILDDPDAIRQFGNKHRKISHTWSKLKLIKEVYGEAGLAQAWIHILLDYGL